MPDDTPDPDLKRLALLKGTRDYDLEEQREARAERTAMLAGFAKEKADLLASVERTTKSKNYIIYALIIANLFQAAMLLGKSLDFSADPSGVNLSTGEGAEEAAP